MKRLGFLLFLVAATSLAEDRRFGPSMLGGGSVDTDTHFMGPVMMAGTEVKKPIRIYGPLTAEGGKFQGRVEVLGPVMVKASRFEEALEVKGPILAGETVFAKDVENYTTFSSFHKCSLIGTYTVHHKGNEEPFVCLDGGSQLADVEFKENKGKIYLGDKESQVKGKLTNGELVSGACPER